MLDGRIKSSQNWLILSLEIVEGHFFFFLRWRHKHWQVCFSPNLSTSQGVKSLLYWENYFPNCNVSFFMLDFAKTCQFCLFVFFFLFVAVWFQLKSQNKRKKFKIIQAVLKLRFYFRKSQKVTSTDCQCSKFTPSSTLKSSHLNRFRPVSVSRT